MKSQLLRSFALLAGLAAAMAWGLPTARLWAGSLSPRQALPPRARVWDMSVSLSPSVASPAPLGTIVTWTADASHDRDGTLWYRFRARLLGGDFQIARDYGPINTLAWTASEHEGTYEIEVSVRNRDTGDTAETTVAYQMTSRVTGGAAVVTRTANPLVFLYSAPPCPAGSQMSVQFASADGLMHSTPQKPCTPDFSMNFYLGGMRSNTAYFVRPVVMTGSQSVTGPVLSLNTPVVSLPLAAYTVLQPPQEPPTNGILLQSTLFEMTVATDLQGNLVWYYQGDISSLTRPEAGGLFLGIYENPTVDPSRQLVREFDLAGTTLRETNAARVSEQLVALGMQPIDAFHHEAAGLPNGQILLLADEERILTDVQGPGPVDVIGDVILVLDRDLQVVWAWDAFDHLDPHRAAVLGETCMPVGSGCAPFYQAPRANDWLHGNSLQFTPDGNILYSSRHQDWLIKIDYNNGQGSGNILWRLGKDGDFRFESSDPYPWFSHQHDGNFEGSDPATLDVFDDGNTRNAADPNAHSRGQVLHLDEQSMVATLLLNADLGSYSFALGSAQKLPNGNYHFDLGWLPQGSATASQSVEVDPSGKIVYAIQVATPEYRSFRMRDLYTP